MRQRAATAGLVLALCALCSVASPRLLCAQEMEVPAAMQVALFLKVMTFDRQRSQNEDTELVVGITFQSGYRSSLVARDEIVRAFRSAASRKIRFVLIDLDRDSLEAALQGQGITLLYVSPLRAISASTLAGIAAAARVTSVTGVPGYVEMGIAVGARLQGDRPRLMVNLTASRQSGADFTSELLKLAEVVQ